jgi:ElaB/YqjD/DUF883 family membrane-anchored ribosome-binding protein
MAEESEETRGEGGGRVGAARQRLQETREELKAKAERAGEYAKERFDTAKESLKHGYDRTRKDVDQLADDVGVYVRDNPGRSIMIAAGIGFLIGFLLRSDKRR